METKFVCPFSARTEVIRRCDGRVIGVFDGVKKFESGYYALLKNGVVSLYSYNNQLVFDKLEDVWVAPNNYILLKKKGEDMWQLYSSSRGVVAQGERIKVYVQDGWRLVFLKQKDVKTWHYFDVGEHSYLPSAKILEADDVEVFYQKTGATFNRLLFILSADGKKAIQAIDSISLKAKITISDVCEYLLLDNGDIAVFKGVFRRRAVKLFTEIFPTQGELIDLYDQSFRLWIQAKAVITLSSELVFVCKSNGEWLLFAGDRLLKQGIAELKISLEWDGVVLLGKTFDGKQVRVSMASPDEVLLWVGDEFSYIIDGRFEVKPKGASDVFFI